MKQTFIIKDTKTGGVIATVIGYMADVIQYMVDHSDLRDHAGVFPQDELTIKA